MGIYTLNICGVFSRTGLKCNLPCSAGTFGVNCTQSCSCSNGGECNRFSGCCRCRPGWFGPNCEMGELDPLPRYIEIQYSMGCGVCGAFPFLAGQTTTVANMGIIYTSSPIFIILISALFFKEKITLTKVIGLVACLIGVFAIIIKGDLELLINLKFTIGDLWMLAAAIGWALYSIYLFYWKTELEIFQRFTLVAFFGAVSLFPFYIGEEIYFQRTVFNNEFYLWTIFAAVSPGIIAFTLYTLAQKQLGASLTGFTLYIFTVYAAIYGYILFDEQLENYHYLGTVLVFFGVYLAKKKDDKKT